MSLPPVLFVHGFGTSFDLTWRTNGWVDLFEDEGRTTIGVDLLGHGSAPKPTEPSEYAGLGARVVEAVGDGPVDAIGFSMGARTLLEIAIETPGRFRKLIVSGVGENLFRSDDHSAVVNAIATGDSGDNPALRYFAGLADLPGNDRAALAACMACVRPPIEHAALAAVTCPTLVVLGDQDFVGSGENLVNALPNAELVTLPRTDHAKTPKSFDFIDRALAFLAD